MMLKAIQFLVYTFSSRLKKTIYIELTDGIPTKDEEDNVLEVFKKKFGNDIIIEFNNFMTGTKITEVYTKK